MNIESRGTSALSVPPRIAPRALTDSERRSARAVADVLVPRVGEDPAATEDPDFDKHLDRALAARRDIFDAVTAVLREVASVAEGDDLRAQLKTLDAERPGEFHGLSTVIVGAWLMSPITRAHIGYPGQVPTRFAVDAGVEELADGRLDGVLERGPVGRRPTT